MQLTIMDNLASSVLGVMNNSLPNSLKYYDSAWHLYLAEGSSTLEFKVSKIKDGKIVDNLEIFKAGNHVKFTEDGEPHFLKMLKVTSNRTTITILCVDITLELLNEDCDAYSPNQSNTIDWYFSVFGLAQGNVIIGINEVKGQTRKLSWDGRQTKLARLMSIVKQFDAEYEFKNILYPSGALRYIVINIYKKNDGKKVQGVGKNRTDINLKIDQDIENISREEDMTGLFNAVEVTGKDGLKCTTVSRNEVDDSGREEFYIRYGESTAYAPFSANMFPANVANENTFGDRWIKRKFETDYTHQDDLVKYMFMQLQKYAYPVITISLDMAAGINWVQYGLNIGDTIKITDMKYDKSGIIIRSRVSEIIKSFDNTATNKIVLTNFIELKSKISSSIKDTMNKMIEDATPYISSISTSSSIIFKKSTDITTLTPIVNKGEKEVDLTSDFSFSWLVNDTEKSTNKSFTVEYSDLTEETNLVTLNIYKNSEKISSAQISLSKIADGISPINLFIKSSNGYQFKNNVINTTFTAILYQNNKEIDSDSTKFSYVWSKTNADGTADTAWNLAHQSSQKSITISNSDVSQRATFNCTAEPLS